MRPSTKLVRFVLCGWFAACSTFGAQAWAQTQTAPARKPVARPATSEAPRGGAQRAAYQEGATSQSAAGPALPAEGAIVEGMINGPDPYYVPDESWHGNGPIMNGYCGPLGYGVLGGLWVRNEYLVWDMKGMYVPPLVISSTVNNIDPEDLHLNDNGDLGATDPVVILYGGRRINSDAVNGWKISAGVWLDDCQSLGLEGDYFGLEDSDDSFFRNSTGTPILSRPFYNVLTGLESSILVAYPNAVNGVMHRGALDIDASTQFHGAGGRAIINLSCNSGCGTNWWNGCPQPTMGRVDLLVGYRYLRLDDSLSIVERSTLTPGGAFNISDQFDAENTFNGFDFGMLLKHQRGAMSVELLSKIALGNTRSRVSIAGDTTITPNGGAAEQFVGGMLAQRTNIGNYSDDEFAVVPELGLTLGYSLNPCWKLTAGYTWLYWSRVARAGDQIDRGINPDLIPEEADPPADTHLQPRFRFVHDDFWAHGLRLGVEGTW